jgi:hypothetical protein
VERVDDKTVEKKRIISSDEYQVSKRQSFLSSPLSSSQSNASMSMQRLVDQARDPDRETLHIRRKVFMFKGITFHIDTYVYPHPGISFLHAHVGNVSLPKKGKNCDSCLCRWKTVKNWRRFWMDLIWRWRQMSQGRSHSLPML